MSFDSLSRRFESGWFLPAAEINEEDPAEAANAPALLPDEASSIFETECVFDDALDQVASEKRCVCSLCGAIVGSDGTVVRAKFRGRRDYSRW
jgi:hypothetical protein